MFDDKYMKLFDSTPNAIRTFGFRIKRFLTASNIVFSDILETPYFVLPPLCQTAEDCAGSGASEKDMKLRCASEKADSAAKSALV